jgi:hypothetical protein
MNTQRKMKKQPKETNVAFVTRLIDYAEEPLTLRMAIDRVHKRTWKPTEVQMRNALSNAVATGAILQKRDVHYKRVVYYSDVTPLQAAHIYENVTPEDERKEEVRAMTRDFVNEHSSQLESDVIVASEPHFDSKPNEDVFVHKRPTITGLVTVTMDADAFVENLHRLDARLYERVLDAIGDSIGVGGSWSRDGNGNMIYEVSI